MTLGELIKDYRKKNNMSVEDFSRVSKISPSMIAKLEADRLSRGVKPNPTMRTVSKVSRATGLSIDEIEEKTGRSYRDRMDSRQRKLRQKETNDSFRSKNAEMKIYTPVRTYEKLKKAADHNGQSVNGMVVGLINKELKKERYKDL